MPDIATTYLGLKLKNPVIVSSSGLTKSVEKVKAAAAAGAGAVVLKSMFEEAIAGIDLGIEGSTGIHAEAMDYLRAELEMQYGPREYCDLIESCKKSTDIPIIASMNCVSSKWWPGYALQLQNSGADAIELNIFTTATRRNQTSAEIEKIYFDIIKQVKGQVNIPLSLKIGSYFTSLPNFIGQLSDLGLEGVVLFNRFTEPDIDIDKLELKTTFEFSKNYELLKSLRWTALISGIMRGDISASTGVKTSKDLIKLLLAGAATVQISSVVYEKGLDTIKEMVDGLAAWMQKHHFETINNFKGKLNFTHTSSPEEYLRAQFIEKIRGIE